ncbi:hypothetical protein [uncultured Shimia sp.]|uniref:hypothetical protein n=1 Tax=uncultured Shimia sp. TaxID=573152 RepID=UPI00260BCE4C|nr:hypothetical protein [uncultured Shimia sp.]
MRNFGFRTLVACLAISGVTPAVLADESSFERCAPLYQKAAAHRLEWDAYKHAEDRLFDIRDYIVRRRDIERDEVDRLEAILKIMQDSDEVWDKYHRAFDRYERAENDLESFSNEASDMYEEARWHYDRSQETYSRISQECPDKMNSSFLETRCSQGNSGYDAICDAFGM